MAENSTQGTQKSGELKNQSEGQFARLMDNLRDCVLQFQRDMTPENFARLISALGAMGFSGANLMRGTTDYVRRHPVRVALGAGLIFFALKGLLQSEEGRTSQRGSTFH